MQLFIIFKGICFVLLGKHHYRYFFVIITIIIIVIIVIDVFLLLLSPFFQVLFIDYSVRETRQVCAVCPATVLNLYRWL